MKKTEFNVEEFVYYYTKFESETGRIINLKNHFVYKDKEKSIKYDITNSYIKLLLILKYYPDYLTKEQRSEAKFYGINLNVDLLNNSGLKI